MCNKVCTLLLIGCTGLSTLSTQTAKLQLMQPSPPPITFPIKFSQNEDIDYAFTKLSAAITKMIKDTNFDCLQVACIEKARSPKMLHKSNKIIPIIKQADSFERLRFMLADTTYWNFLDIRMMEAMATASMIPAAQETIENFKKSFFSMTLKEAAPYFPVIKVKPNHTELHEDLDRDPSQMTIGELHKHRFYLETEILGTGPNTCTICRIMIGSVAIVWQIHGEHVYQAYSRLKRLHPQLLLLKAIRFMSIPAMEKWEGLPFLWHGQDIDQIGPIESSTCVRHEQYPLPQGFEWSILNSSNFNEIIQLYNEIDPRTPMTRNHLKWFISLPDFKKGCLSGIRLSSSKKLVWYIACTPYHIKIGRKVLSLVNLQQTIGPDAGKNEFQLYNVGIKETMRILGSKGIFQAAIFTKQHVFPRPVINYDVYSWLPSVHSLPYLSPKTARLRRMKQSDVPKALALTNQYTSQFEIGQVFQSEKEFSHWFLSPHDVTTFVVEESDGGNITDMFSFRVSWGCGQIVGEVIAIIVTKSPAAQLITDLLICISQQKATMVTLPRFGLKEHLFKGFMKTSRFVGQGHCLFYNYKYHEVDNDNHCIFGHIN